jgi:hypothetical protein
MSRPESAADLADRDSRAEPTGTEPRIAVPPAPSPGGPDPWEGYDLAILNAVLDS